MRTVLDFHQGRARDDLLFTMSNNTRTAGRTRTGANLFKLLDEQRGGSKAGRHGLALTARDRTARDRSGSLDRQSATANLVEPDGIEPTTSCLQSRRSPN